MLPSRVLVGPLVCILHTPRVPKANSIPCRSLSHHQMGQGEPVVCLGAESGCSFFYYVLCWVPVWGS